MLAQAKAIQAEIDAEEGVVPLLELTLGEPEASPTAVAPIAVVPEQPEANIEVVDEKKFYRDTRGRLYPLDEYGNRIRKSSRPPFIHPSEWEHLGADKKKAITAKYQVFKEKCRTDAARQKR